MAPLPLASMAQLALNAAIIFVADNYAASFAAARLGTPTASRLGYAASFLRWVRVEDSRHDRRGGTGLSALTRAALCRHNSHARSTALVGLAVFGDTSISLVLLLCFAGYLSGAPMPLSVRHIARGH